MNIHPKVTAAVLGSAIATILIYGFNLAGVTLDVGMQGSLTTIAVFAAGYLTSSS